jgi:hypothetical protein
VLDGLRMNLSLAVTDAAKQWPEMQVREGVRKVCNDIGITGGWL